MLKSLVSLLVFLTVSALQAQPLVKEKKYPSLLWEISGRGMKKPSYLIGTMHVSSKLAFHLPDSFYIALRGAQVVALETNPDTWQEDMSRYDLDGNDYSGDGSFYDAYTSMPADYLSINTLRYFKYDIKIEKALASNPSVINNLLYRSYGNGASDFEEDTYLDMYIFQCGKKWSKTVCGVENYGESMRLMAEAYKDAARDKTKKDRSFGDWDDDYSTDKLQEAYRMGNLDLLDSINKYNSFSAAFDEKFLYRRNEIQARSIDSILRSGKSLFVGVGAAHLPGDRGVIEWLRKMGYRLRPVKMGERASREKDLVDKIRVPVNFNTQTADDSFFSVDIPGKFYQNGDAAAAGQLQYADMSNGSYYMVTRILTHAWLWGQGADEVAATIDSLLYENIPGKIISKTKIIRNGYKGFDIMNRTRRGDLQRYHIFITPFEVIVFKMSGNGDYIKSGPEADKFFGSIRFREYTAGNGDPAGAWKKYAPVFGGFAAEFPHEPLAANDGNRIWDATDPVSATHYRVIRTDIHNYHFLGEDTFDLGLLDESFRSSAFIDSTLDRRPFQYQGYPALDVKYRDQSGALILARYIIRGPHYYTLLTRGPAETSGMLRFLNSFSIRPFVYGDPRPRRDTSLYFTVNSPVFPEPQKIRLNIPRYGWSTIDDEETESEEDQLEGGTYRSKTVANDSTGEKIFISFFRSPRYYYTRDSAALEKDQKSSYFADTSLIYRRQLKTEWPDKTKVWEAIVTDTGSSRTLWTKVMYRNGIGFALGTESDTLSVPSAFIKSFFETFRPFDSLRGVNPFEKKSALFFADLMSTDSVLHNRALKHIDEVALDSADLPALKAAISALNWKEKKYLDTKTALIGKLGRMATPAAADYLKQLYYNLDDTVQLQYTALENLLRHKNAYAYGLFRDIIAAEPPVLDYPAADYVSEHISRITDMTGKDYSNGRFLDNLFDSLELTRTILPVLLPLLNLDDYENSILRLLAKLVEKKLVGPADYSAYEGRFLLAAKQELKKQSIAEKKRSIEKAEESKTDKKKSPYTYDDDEKDAGNTDLGLYATLLLPFEKSNPSVMPLIGQMLRSDDKQLRYATLLLLIKNDKPVPDSLLYGFAAMDDYRYELYTDLKSSGRLKYFPARYNNHFDLGRSELMNESSYNKPDTLVYLERRQTSIRYRQGFVYFYKYKSKKDDLAWKLAWVGLVPLDSGQYQFEDSLQTEDAGSRSSLFEYTAYQPHHVTELSDIKIKEELPLSAQLEKALRKILYSRRKSAKEFYTNENDRPGIPDYTD